MNFKTIRYLWGWVTKKNKKIMSLRREIGRVRNVAIRNNDDLGFGGERNEIYELYEFYSRLLSHRPLRDFEEIIFIIKEQIEESNVTYGIA